ncbi:MAG: hypothetical protein R6X35_08720, partial [Candidatus Krumholzibacteriia bacterium]
AGAGPPAAPSRPARGARRSTRRPCRRAPAPRPAGAARGREPRDARISRARIPWLRLRAAAPVPIYMDGEYCGEHHELDVRVLPGALRLL